LFIQMGSCIKKIILLILFTGNRELPVHDHHFNAFPAHP